MKIAQGIRPCGAFFFFFVLFPHFDQISVKISVLGVLYPYRDETWQGGGDQQSQPIDGSPFGCNRSSSQLLAERRRNRDPNDGWRWHRQSSLRGWHHVRTNPARRQRKNWQPPMECQVPNVGIMRIIIRGMRAAERNLCAQLRRTLPFNRTSDDINRFLDQLEEECRRTEEHDSDEFV